MNYKCVLKLEHQVILNDFIKDIYSIVIVQFWKKQLKFIKKAYCKTVYIEIYYTLYTRDKWKAHSVTSQ